MLWRWGRVAYPHKSGQARAGLWRRHQMPHRLLGFCKCPGCAQKADDISGYCSAHKGESQRHGISRDRHLLPAHIRGYDKRWERYSKWFLSQPQNQMCALRLDAGCTIIAQCVDHIDPPDGARDPRFWDRSNHQPACIHCNSVKGHRFIRGTAAVTLTTIDASSRPLGGI